MIIEKATRLTMHEARRNSGYFPHKVPFGWNAVGVRSGTLTYVGYAPPPPSAPSKGILRCLLWYTIRYEWRKKRQ